MNAVDAIYVLVGYKIDKSTVDEVRASFAQMRREAGLVRNDFTAAGRALDKMATEAAQAAGKQAEATTKQGERAQSFMDRLEKAAKLARQLWPVIVGVAALRLGQQALGAYLRDVGEIKQLAAATNTTTEAFSTLAYVAKIAGVPVDDLRDGLNDLSEKAGEASKAMREGKGATNEYAIVFKELGIDLNRFLKLKPDERFTQFADAINAVKDPGRRSAIVMKLMSDEGTKFNTIFQMGTSRIEAYRKEARELGAVLGKDGVAALGRYSIATSRLELRVKAIRDAFGQAFTPVLAELAEEVVAAISAGDIRAAAKSARAFAKAARDELVPALRAVIKMARGIAEVVDDLGGLGNAMKLGLIIFTAYRLAVIANTVALGGWSKAALVAGKSAAALTGKVLLLAIPFLLFEDYAGWEGGKESVIGWIFGERTQANMLTVTGYMTTMLSIATLLIAALFGAPAAVAALLASFGYLVYDSFDLLRDQWRMAWEDMGGWAMAWIGVLAEEFAKLFPDWIRDKMLTTPGVGAGSVGGGASAAASQMAAGTVSRSATINAPVQVTVNTAATDPQGTAAAVAGEAPAIARTIHAQYDDGER